MNVYQKLMDCWKFYSTSSLKQVPSPVCKTRDIFHARLDNLFREAQAFGLEQDGCTLLIAVVGEIGNNSFDHNLGQWCDIPGCWLSTLTEQTSFIVALADRGNGFLKTLKRVIPELVSEQQAIEVAFTARVSGRAPERRGNGLKFVSQTIDEHPRRSLLCLSGDGAYDLGGYYQYVQEECLNAFQTIRERGKGVFTLIEWGKS